MPGPRVFELEEAQRLLPQVQKLLREIQAVRGRLKELKIRVNALEMIWGSQLQAEDCPDRGEFEHHIEAMKKAEQEFETCTRAIAALGGHLKGLDPPLVDFYGVREGRLIFWCWQDGEDEITDWHHIDEGFSGRQRV
jgi:hypothetical protein